MNKIETHRVPESYRAKAHIDRDKYAAMYRHSIETPDSFWAEQADTFIDWYRRWDSVCEADFVAGRFAWFSGAKLNASYNCIDRHLQTRGDQVAIIWESDDPARHARITYNQLHRHVCQLANALKTRGVQKGDRVCIYMPMIP
ncbi:MAG: AMP-binding protein, partial [Proteobacteria bacterium]|nr:AMP-binding protein [Pseudomonadota bacterium]